MKQPTSTPIQDRPARKYGLKEITRETTHESIPSRIERISVRAYHLWARAGKHAGRDLEFWLQAEREDNEKCSTEASGK